MVVFFLTLDEVKPVCAKLRYPDVSAKDRFASIVCSHDGGGFRSEIVDALDAVSPVSCPGRYRHNDDSLVTDYADDKMAYLKKFCFNICPENTNAYGYVTEKLFQAISSGCIPVYWGSYNRPEEDVLNRDAIIFWNRGGDNSSNIKLIEDLMASPSQMKEFMAQPRLLPTAEEYISDTMSDIEKRITNLLAH